MVVKRNLGRSGPNELFNNYNGVCRAAPGKNSWSVKYATYCLTGVFYGDKLLFRTHENGNINMYEGNARDKQKVLN